MDALAGDYPGLGGYVYCAGNPVRLVDVDGRRVKIANPTSFELLLKGLPPQTRNTITMNDDYTLNVASVKNALEASPSSGNLKALYAIAKDDRLVDFDVTATSYQFVDSETHCTETYDFQSPTYQNEFRELINSFSGTEDEKSQYISTLNSIGIYDETLVNGNFGATLRPRNAQIKYQGGQISTDDNFKVFINPIGTTLADKVRYIGHELYGHLYVFFIGGDPRHDNSNVLLNTQIVERENESIINLNYE